MNDTEQTEREQTDDSGSSRGPNDARYIEHGPGPDGASAGVVLDTELPADLRTALGRFVGRDSVDTIGEWIEEVRRRTEGDAISREALCHAGEQTEHWGDLEGERYYFVCFYDAVILAALADRPVDIRTESPDGDVIEAEAVGDDELRVTPESAVFSFGISEDVSEADDRAVEDAYGEMCPYVKAFPDRAAYEQWAADVPAVTVAMPLAGATELAAALAA